MLSGDPDGFAELRCVEFFLIYLLLNCMIIQTFTANPVALVKFYNVEPMVRKRS